MSRNPDHTQPQSTLKVGPLILQSNVVLAPMSGVTDGPFRSLVKESGDFLVISEMIASMAMIRQTKRSLHMATHERPMAVQLAGCDPYVMAEAARLNEDLGARMIDINMGCPVKKVVNGHAGASLMRDEELARRILKSVVASVSIPVTLKMRKGWDDHTQNAPHLAKIAEDVGIQMITVHGRTRCQLYTGKADWIFIKRVKEAVSIPVIGNGDVTTVHHAQELLKLSGANGVMVGRGCYGKPWFLQHIHSFLHQGVIPTTPSLMEQKNLVLRHLHKLIEAYGPENGIKIARRHIGWYSKSLAGSSEFRSQVNQQTHLTCLVGLIENFYEDLLQQAP